MDHINVNFMLICALVFFVTSKCQGANQVILTCGGNNEDSIPGPAGPPGKQGPPGVTGPRGLQGVPGANDTWKNAFNRLEARLEKLENAFNRINESINMKKTNLQTAGNNTGLQQISCRDAKSGGSNSNGVYSFNSPVSYRGYCDMETDGGGWLVIQKRYDGSTDFSRGWEEYENGFGLLTKEFWIGLRLIHQLTAWRAHELRIDLENFDSTKVHAKYSIFSIGSADTFYRLNVAGFSGNAGDRLAYHNQMSFTTKDQDHDRSTGNCAVTYLGAWWHNNCHQSNLNGKYFNEETTDATSNRWNPASRKSSEIKIRPVLEI